MRILKTKVGIFTILMILTSMVLGLSYGTFVVTTEKYDVLELKSIITEHVAYTNSEKGKHILDNFAQYLPKFKKIISYDYAAMLKKIVQMEEKGLSSEQAKIEAFYAIAK